MTVNERTEMTRKESVGGEENRKRNRRMTAKNKV